MSKIVWKAVIVLSLAMSALLIAELAFMWWLLKEDGVRMAFDRRSDGTLGLANEIASLAVSALWLLSKLTSSGCEKRTAGALPSHELTSDQTSVEFRRGEFAESLVVESDSVTEMSLDDSSLWEESSESLFEESSYGSINPANGLPMIGSIDVEGNAYGTASIDSCSIGIGEDLCGGFSDSLLDDGLSMLNDDSV